jgi:hypothetical protein
MQDKHGDSLRALVRFEGSFAALQDSLRDLPYDYRGSPVVLTSAHVAHALRRCLNDEVTATELEAWAELIQGRPGIEYEPGQQETLANILFKLSTPDINEPISAALCWRILKTLHVAN